MSEPSWLSLLFTFRIVVEDTVVGASLRVRIPKTLATAAEWRKLDFLLLQLLLYLSPQGFGVPTAEAEKRTASDRGVTQGICLMFHISAYELKPEVGVA